jgi:hypothetical protein
MSEEKRCPVGGVDRSDKVDRISIQNAVETPFWMAVWAAEPEHMIDVRMSYSDLKVICDLIDQKRIAAEWRYSDKERPTREGVYWCVLIHDEYMDSKPTGRKLAELETRWYGTVEDDVSRSWVMDGEPETGLVWTKDLTESWMHERVYAWKPTLKDDPSVREIKLPDGVEWGDET